MNVLKRYFQLILVVLAAGSIYPLVYLKQNYQETILQVFNMDLTQLNTIFSILGIVFVVGYFPSGLISDKFSSKKLLTISLLGTAAGGFWFAQVPNFTGVALIYCIWGVFSVFTFWSAHMKLVKLLSTPEDEGRFFGILDGGRGVVEALLATISIAIFAHVLGGSDAIADKKDALVTIIYMYSFVLVAVAILIFIFVKEDQKTPANDADDAPAKEKFHIKDVGLIFKNKYVFLLGGIIFMSYAVTWTIYYFGGFMETNVGVNAVKVGTVMVIVQWMRPVGGIVGGFLGDKIGKRKILSIALIGSAAALLIMAILPVGLGATPFYILVVGAAIFIYAIRGTYWSLLGDAKVDDKLIGVTIGFASVIGYLPDIILPLYNSALFKAFGDNGGYNAYWISNTVFGLIGVALIVLFGVQLKKDNAKEAALKKAN
ncbi:MAG: MFS transporter [Clostridiales Family XIII bacterium]|jgi:MFS family permease|nr:MFS transporter [Clostridiales Family XIII bacterium]